jgi:hypothetical protein
MRTQIKSVKILNGNAILRACVISVLFAAFFIASLYMLINSPA